MGATRLSTSFIGAPRASSFKHFRPGARPQGGPANQLAAGATVRRPGPHSESAHAPGAAGHLGPREQLLRA
eukprot:11014471-Alexandrium_andersonii.AAC.1